MSLEEFLDEWHRQANEYGASLTQDQRDIAEQAWLIATQKEREACATLVEKNADMCGPNTMLCDVLRGNAAAIRARGESDAY